MADRSSANSTRLESLDALRGIAALAVCWYHMTHGGKLLGNGFAAHASSFGFLGVEVFFVISGFVIPFSMEKTNYHWGHFGSYFKKRLLRVHPPFLIASILAVLLNVISSFVPGYAGSIGKGYLSEALLSLATDSTYLSGVLGRPWILVVAWTLAIEVQFYLLAGIVFPLVAMCGPWMRVLVLPALASTAWVFPDSRFLPAFLPFFVLGWVGIGLRARHGRAEVTAALLTGVVVFALSPLPAVIVALLAFGFILFWKAPVSRPWLWLGTVSYSLYLVHIPIGGRVVNLLERHVAAGWQMGLVALLGTFVSLAAAWGFWRAVEAPFHRMATRRRNCATSEAVR